MNFKNTMQLSAMLFLGAALMSCTPEGDGDLSYDEASRQQVTFPKLDTFMPEEDVPSQKRSAKKGICTNFRIGNMPDILGEGVSWCYNWGHAPFTEDRWSMLESNGMTFYPMVWNAGFDENSIGSFMLRHPEDNYILAYNEPNLTDQANMTPEQAAEHWPGLVDAAKRLGMKIVGPAVNYGTLAGYSDPVKWYDDFLAQPGVSLDDIDAIALHCYMPTGEAVKALMIRKFAKYGKPIWLTEFANGEAKDVASQLNFLQQCCTYLEADPLVERYAWFMDNIGKNTNLPHVPIINLPDKDSAEPKITDLGRLYLGMSTFDKTNWYDVDVNIPAEHYSGQIVEETAAEDGWGPMVETRITDDFYGNFEIFNLRNDSWVEYNINVPETSKYRIDLRYFATAESVVKIDCKGAVSAIASLAVSDMWGTYGVEMTLPKGRQTIRLYVPSGHISLNWLRVTSPVK